jgi:hypothetical protein
MIIISIEADQGSKNSFGFIASKLFINSITRSISKTYIFSIPSNRIYKNELPAVNLFPRYEFKTCFFASILTRKSRNVCEMQGHHCKDAELGSWMGTL